MRVKIVRLEVVIGAMACVWFLSMRDVRFWCVVMNDSRCVLVVRIIWDNPIADVYCFESMFLRRVFSVLVSPEDGLGGNVVSTSPILERSLRRGRVSSFAARRRFERRKGNRRQISAVSRRPRFGSVCGYLGVLA